MKEEKKTEDNRVNKKNENSIQEQEIHLLFNQLINYYKFHRKLDELLENGNFESENDINSSMSGQKSFTSVNTETLTRNKYIQNTLCLIDKSWIKKWKNYIGYSDIVKLYKKNHLNETDYDGIKPIIIKNSSTKKILPLNMSNIYINNEKLDINSNFDIIFKSTFEKFFQGNLKEKPLLVKCYSVKILKYKYIIKLDNKTLQIVFRERTHKKYNELIIIFNKESKEKSKLLNEFELEDINDWLINNKFKIDSDMEKEITKFDCLILIINKTLKRIFDEQKRKLYNTVNPYPQSQEIMAKYKISDKNIELMENQVIKNKKYLTKIKNNSIIANYPTKVDKQKNKQNNPTAKRCSILNYRFHLIIFSFFIPQSERIAVFFLPPCRRMLAEPVHGGGVYGS
jgi:hypothetical protein